MTIQSELKVFVVYDTYPLVAPVLRSSVRSISGVAAQDTCSYLSWLSHDPGEN